MAFCVIRLRNIVKQIHVLSAVEIDLTKTKTFIEGKLAIRQAERRRLDEKVDNGDMSSSQWDLKTDVLDYLIASNEVVVAELATKISDMTYQRYKLQEELDQYDAKDIERAMNSVGVWE